MRWTVILPYYNEAAFIGDTLRSIAAQTVKPIRLILIDNASTDGSEAVARAALAGAEGVEAVHLHEARPGKINALAAAMPRIDTPFVAFCDADTIYPPHYLAAAERLYADAGVASALAMDLYGDPASPANRRRMRLYARAISRLLDWQCHTGGFGQTFRTEAFRAAGGYSESQWPFVLMDHEIMHRVMKIGRVAYAEDFWCLPSPRRASRRRVRWTLPERALYHVTPYRYQGWFFYRFLARRFARRGLWGTNLRQQAWQPGGQDGPGR